MKYIFTIILVFFSGYAMCQNKTISGIVFDKNTSEALENVTVKSLDNKTSITNNAGRFSLELIDSILLITCAGYETIEFSVQGEGVQQIGLIPSGESLEQVIVTGNRFKQRRKEAPVSIALISKEEIEEAKATRLDELLNKVSGVNMVSLGNEQHQMSIRQPITTKSLFLYLEDGIPVRTTGLYNHNGLLEMNMTSSRQIEIIKGPASAVYGAEAIGGVINVITQAPPSGTMVKAALQGNHNGYMRFEGQAGRTSGKFGFLISGYHARLSNGEIEHNDFRKSALTAKGEYKFSKHTGIITDVTYINFYSDMPGTVDSATFANKEFHSLQHFTYRKVPLLRAKSQLFHQWNDDSKSQISLVFRKNEIEQNPSYRIKNSPYASVAHGEINESSFRSYMIIAQHQHRLKFLKSTLVGGISYDGSPSEFSSRYILIHRDEHGEYTSYNDVDSLLGKYKTIINNLASFINWEASPAKRIRVSASLRYDRYHYNFSNALDISSFSGASSSKQCYDKISPKLGVTYNIKHFGGYANYSHGFVPPQISELYNGVKVPVLEPQVFYNYEIGGWTSLAKHKLYAEISAYILNGSNEIVSVRNPDGSVENRNTGKTTHRGLEYGLHYKPSEKWFFRFTGSNTIHSYVQFVEKGKNYSDNQMPGGPKFFCSSEVTFKPEFIHGLRLSGEWRKVSSYFMDNQNTEKASGYNVFSARLAYKVKEVEIWVNVNNITNRYYAANAFKSSSYSYTPGDPREIFIGISYTLNKN